MRMGVHWSCAPFPEVRCSAGGEEFHDPWQTFAKEARQPGEQGNADRGVCETAPAGQVTVVDDGVE